MSAAEEEKKRKKKRSHPPQARFCNITSMTGAVALEEEMERATSIEPRPSDKMSVAFFEGNDSTMHTGTSAAAGRSIDTEPSAKR